MSVLDDEAIDTPGKAVCAGLLFTGRVDDMEASELRRLCDQLADAAIAVHSRSAAGLREALQILNGAQAAAVDDPMEGDDVTKWPYFHAKNVLLTTIANREGKSIGQVADEMRGGG